MESRGSRRGIHSRFAGYIFVTHDVVDVILSEAKHDIVGGGGRIGRVEREYSLTTLNLFPALTASNKKVCPELWTDSFYR